MILPVDGIARVTTMPFEALERLRAARTTERLEPALELERRIATESTALSAELHALAGGHRETGGAGVGERHALLALRRDVFNRRLEPAAPAPEVMALLPRPLAGRVRRLATDLERARAGRVALAEAFAADLECAERSVAEMARDPLFEEGLRLVGRSLLAKVRDMSEAEPGRWRHRERQALSKAVSFVTRFTTKTSPNGVFCATARVGLGGVEPGIAGDNTLASVLVRLSVAEARKVTASLAVEPALGPLVAPRPNPTLRREDGHWTFWRCATPRDPQDIEVRARAADHPVLEAFLEEASHGTLDASKLIAAVAARCGLDPSSEALGEFYRKLLTHGLLIAELEIPWSATRPMEFLARACASLEPPPAWRNELEAIERQLDHLGALDSRSRIDAMDAIETRIAALPHARALARDDLFRLDAATALRIELPREVVADVGHALAWYARLYAGMYPARLFCAGYARRFLERFAPDTDVEALELYGNLFERPDPPRPSSFPEPPGVSEGGPGTPPAREAYRRIRDELAARARDAAGDEVVIEDRDWERLVGDVPAPRYSCGVLFQLAARDLGALKSGEWRACIGAIYPGGGLSVARLAALHGEGEGGERGWIADELNRGARWLRRPGIELAEISFMHGGRTANAGLRPPLLAVEIELPGDRSTPGREAIPLSDLVVRYDSVAAEFRLRSKRLAVGILPVVTSGISSEGFVSFLVEVGRQHTQPIAYFPGFEADGVDRWPRVRTGRTVLFRRRWRRPAGELASLGARGIDLDAFVRTADWRARHGLPRHVFAHSDLAPKPFYVDLESPLLVQRFLQAFGPPGTARDVGIHVTEMLPGPDELWVRDRGGRYASEFLAHVTHSGVDANDPAAGR